MLTTHIFLNGDCKEAIETYKSALGATVKTIFEKPNSHLIVHVEIVIHDELLMLNDFGENEGFLRREDTSFLFALTIRMTSKVHIQVCGSKVIQFVQCSQRNTVLAPFDSLINSVFDGHFRV